MNDQTILVTGASRGIGSAIAKRLAADGFHILINYRSGNEAAQETLSAITEAGGSGELLPFDVSDRAAVKAAIEGYVEAKGVPYGVVVNAGITRDGLMAMMSDEEWDAVIDTGLHGFWNVVKPLITPMIQAKRGRIVGMASTSGQMGNAGQVNYAAAKGGLIAAVKSLAKEVARRGITANVVAPGLIDTDMTKDLPLKQMLQIVPMRRIGTVEEVAGPVSFLMGSDSNYLTGQVLAPNGGLYT